MSTELLIVAGVVILLVVGVNGLLILALRRNRGSGFIRLWQKAGRRARNPWQSEDEKLEELSRLVDRIKDADQ